VPDCTILRLPPEIRLEIFRHCLVADPSTQLVDALRPVPVLYREAWRALCEVGVWDLNKVLKRESLVRSSAFLRAVRHVRVNDV